VGAYLWSDEDGVADILAEAIAEPPAAHPDPSHTSPPFLGFCCLGWLSVEHRGIVRITAGIGQVAYGLGHDREHHMLPALVLLVEERVCEGSNAGDVEVHAPAAATWAVHERSTHGQILVMDAARMHCTRSATTS
jgi:hypothetical protein